MPLEDLLAADRALLQSFLTSSGQPEIWARRTLKAFGLIVSRKTMRKRLRKMSPEQVQALNKEIYATAQKFRYLVEAIEKSWDPNDVLMKRILEGSKATLAVIDEKAEALGYNTQNEPEHYEDSSKVEDDADLELFPDGSSWIGDDVDVESEMPKELTVTSSD